MREQNAEPVEKIYNSQVPCINHQNRELKNFNSSLQIKYQKEI